MRLALAALPLRLYERQQPRRLGFPLGLKVRLNALSMPLVGAEPGRASHAPGSALGHDTA